MSDGTKIEWTDATANVINGCSVVSPGCTNCYAMRLAGTRMKHHPTRTGLTIDTKAGPVWNGEVRFNEKALMQVLSWTKPRMIFWNAHGDMFHDSVPDEWIDKCFAVMALTSHHTHQVLTKRSKRMGEYITKRSGDFKVVIVDAARKSGATLMQCRDTGWTPWPLPNVWLGVSVEDQTRADERVPDLLATPAAVRWISAEPLLGPVDLREIGLEDTLDVACNNVKLDALTGYHRGIPRLDGRIEVPSLPSRLPGIDWVVAGGESGPNARPMHPDWARKLRDDCAMAGVPFLFKQWGEFAPVHDRDIEDPDWRNCGQWQHSHPKGRWHNLAGGTGFHGDRVVYMDRPGKSIAGRMLDGEAHDGYPS